MAYKAYKAAKGAPQGRDAKRMMQKMGMKIDEIEGVTEVLIRTATREIIIKEPVVTSVVVQGQRMYQITGGSAHERTPSAEAAQPEVPEEDVNLVVTQTGKTVDDAKVALKESGGDLAEAILRLKQKNQA
jgi:nascent polypeptide-associated complex subunit alpha